MTGVAFFPYTFPGPAPLAERVACAFTSRRGGASQGAYASANLSFDVGDDAQAVRANRAALAERLGFSAWLECRQVHGTTMHFDPLAGDRDQPSGLEGDGLATTRPGHALVVKTADCQPLLLAHGSGKYIAALHVGWRGNAAGFPQLGVARFCEHYGLDPADIWAVRGPSLGPEQAEFTNFSDEFGMGFQDWYDPGTRTVDLWQLTRDQLLEAGLRSENIHGLDLCTASMADTFFSYRREKVSGRQAGIVWIKKQQAEIINNIFI